MRRAAEVLAVVVVLAIGLGAAAYGVMRVGEEVDRETERVHVEHHVTGERACGCAPGVEELRAEVLDGIDMVSQRIDAIESRCVWLGPHKVPVMRVGR